ncbi:MAG: heme-dependent oxidative N-demethylase family protein [Ilumatobacteraceae bacterium]
MSVTVDAPYAPYVDVDRERFRWRFGLSPLALEDWIEWGPDAEWAITEKRRINAEHHDTVFASIDGIEPEVIEVADALLAHVRSRWPDRYSGAELDPELHPLEAAARLVPEDLVLLVERNGRLVFGGGSVCFPNRWDLRSKLGRTLAEVHAPVPRLNDQLGTRIDSFLAHLTPERAFTRVGWGIIDTDELFTPPSDTPRTTPRVADLHLRVERETLRRFPETKCVLFTFRTHLTPLAAAPEPAALAAAVDVLPADVREYKQLIDIADELVTVLVGTIPQA